MAAYVDPNTDPDLNGSAIPDGQVNPASPAKAPEPVTSRRDPSLSLDILGDGGDSLDKLRDQKIKDKEDAEATAAGADGKSTDGGAGDNGGADGGGKGAPAPADPKAGAAGDKRPSAIPVVDDEPTTPDGKPSVLDEIKPPEGTSPKTAEAWDNFKAKAREQIEARENQLREIETAKKDLEAKFKDLEAKAAKAPTPEQEAEIAELRKWHAAAEVETAPELVSLDTKLTANTDTLLTKLKEAGMVEPQLDEIRKIGITKVNWDELKPHMSTQLKQFVDAKVLQHVNLSEDRDSTFKALKNKGDEFLKQRKEQQIQAQQRETQAFEGTVEQFMKAKPFSFLQPQEVPADAPADRKAAIEEDNKFAKAMLESIAQWKANLNDPAMRAELLFGGVMAYKFQRDLAAEKARSEALKKELEEANSKFDKVKRASGAGRRTGGATPPAPAPGSQFVRDDGSIKTADEALDELSAHLRR